MLTRLSAISMTEWRKDRKRVRRSSLFLIVNTVSSSVAAEGLLPLPICGIMSTGLGCGWAGIGGCFLVSASSGLFYQGLVGILHRIALWTFRPWYQLNDATSIRVICSHELLEVEVRAWKDLANILAGEGILAMYHFIRAGIVDQRALVAILPLL